MLVSEYDYDIPEGVVSLNVGGQSFATSRATLIRVRRP